VSEITYDEEFARDWDWYAVDSAGRIAHFTTAGLRLLPRSVKQDREAAESLIDFFERLPTGVSGWRLRKGLENDVASLKSSSSRARLEESYSRIASLGLFEFDTEPIHGSEARYFLAAIPEKPLCVTDLPDQIRVLLERTRSMVSFPETEYIPEKETKEW
jgi:hypothetical protein